MNKLIINTKVIDIAGKSIIIKNNTIFVNNKKYLTRGSRKYGQYVYYMHKGNKLQFKINKIKNVFHVGSVFCSERPY